MLPDPVKVDDYSGFEPIFDGTLTNWDGDPAFWRVENGTIVGETTPGKKLKMNTFLVWRGGRPANFELKADIKMNSTNSGIQFRSAELPEVGKWVLKGYQADIDFVNRFTGLIYEERARGFLAPRGQMTLKEEGKKPRVIAEIKNGDDVKGAVKIQDWNTIHVVARGNTLFNIINGQLASAFVDDDPAGRAASGLIGFQIHVGEPMKLEVRNVYLKKLP
jgi:hypothetical protein